MRKIYHPAKNRIALSLFTVTLSVLIFGLIPARASLMVDADFTDVGFESYQMFEYDDSGWFTVTTTNTSDTAWGDFHFFIAEMPESFQLSFPGYNYDISEVVFVGSGPDQPTSSQSGLTWALSDNDKAIDLFYYSDPLDIGETGTFSVHIENPEFALHGVGLYPTPVPEPGSFLLIGTGSFVAFRFKNFLKKRRLI